MRRYFVMMNRRFFRREAVRANGEFVWATKSRLGRVSTNREFITTKNLSIDGAKIAIKGAHHFPVGCHARVKFGLEFCDVEVLEAFHSGSTTELRIIFRSPSKRFVNVIEKWLHTETENRHGFESVWT